MKNRYLLSILIILISNLIYAQVDKEYLKIEYVLDVKLDSEKILKSIPQDQKAKYESMLKSEMERGIYVDYSLITNGDYSSFKLEDKLNNDPTKTNQIVNQIRSLDNKPLIKDLKSNIFYKGYDMGGMQPVVKDSLKNYNWKLTRDTKTINGYKVSKAEGINDGKAMIAWYSTDLKYKDGPDQFHGLPGVILEIKFYNKRFDVDLEFRAKNISQMGNNVKIKNYSENKYFTENQLLQLINEINEKYRENTNSGVDKD